MIVSCPSCSVRYKLDQSKITGRGARITCPRCKHIFIIRPPEDEPPTNEVSLQLGQRAPAGTPPTDSSRATMPPTAPDRSADTLDFQSVGLSLKAKIKIGLVYDFSDLATLRRYIADGRVTSEDMLSTDGRDWVVIGSIPDLNAHVLDLYDRAEKAMKASGAPAGGNGFEDEDDPTAIIGVGSLGSDLAREALDQISGIEPSPSPSPSPSEGMAREPAGGNNFNSPVGEDPFAALMQQQRQQKRQGGASAKKATAKKPASASGGSSSNRLVALVALVALLGGAWWFTRSSETNPTPITRAPTPPTAETAAETTSSEEDEATQDAAKAALDRIMQEANQERDSIEETIEEPQLIPVGPSEDDLRRLQQQANSDGLSISSPSYAANPNSYTGGGSGVTVLSGASASVENGDMFYAQGDWASAASEYKKAIAAGQATGTVHQRYVNALMNTGDVAAANSHCQQYKSSYPNLTQACSQI